MPKEVFTLFFFLGFMIILFTVVYLILTKPFSKRTDDRREMDAVSRYLLSLGFVLIVFSFLAPYFVFFELNGEEGTGEKKNFYGLSGSIGDTLGGLMNPFVAIAGVIVTGLAFYMQFKANKAVLEANDQLKDQFKLQQFESQFYEMIRLHKENVNEMSIEGYVAGDSVHRKAQHIYTIVKLDKLKLNGLKNRLYHSGNTDQSRAKKEITGRKVFYLMVKELEACFQVIKTLHYPQSRSEYTINKGKVYINSDRRDGLFRLAYHVFFSGKDVLRKQIDKNEIETIIEGDANVHFYEDFLRELKILRTSHKYGVRHLKNYFSEELVSQDLYLDFSYLPFGGHQIRLGHYYRHMLSLVKHVVDQPNDFLTYEDKRKYLKIFRAQLSNHEVVLLFYNWLGEYGCAWEEDVKDSMGRNKYFTDYRILHNLNKHLVLNEFDPLELFNSTEFVYKKGQKKNDLLFELYGIESSLNEDENLKFKSKEIYSS
jgi:hypothetical protein